MWICRRHIPSFSLANFVIQNNTTHKWSFAYKSKCALYAFIFSQQSKTMKKKWKSLGLSGSRSPACFFAGSPFRQAETVSAKAVRPILHGTRSIHAPRRTAQRNVKKELPKKEEMKQNAIQWWWHLSIYFINCRPPIHWIQPHYGHIFIHFIC